MKKAIARGIVFIITFFVSVLVIGKVMNHGNTDMTTEMSPATFPLLYMEMEGRQVNCLHGYAQEMEGSYQRENITPLQEGRTLSFTVNTFGQKISKISYEVRSVDGSRLVENTEVTRKEENKDIISAVITLKDLIETEKEYSLIILLENNEGQIIRYYTRIIQSKEYYVEEKLAFIKEFHEKSFDKEEANDLTKYLEPNAEGDNTTYQKVTIHSSLSQLTWGDLNVKRESEPHITIKEIDVPTGIFTISYLVSTGKVKEKTFYRVQEYYRIRYTADRMYLLDFERTMNQILDENSDSYGNSKIVLGITDPNLPFMESDGGSIFAFVNENRLYSYNITDNKLAVIHSFYDVKNIDERTVYPDNGIKILNVDETGNVQYMLYGYMNRGRHEGYVGLQICSYNSQMNTIEEEIFIPCTTSFQVLEAEVEQFAYVSKTNRLYIMLNRAVYVISLEDKTYEILVSNLKDGCFQVSESNAMLVWQEGQDLYSSTSLTLMDLNTKKQIQIDAGSDEFIAPLGFMGEDLIYGLAKRGDIHKDNTGRVTFPMYKVIIQDESGKILHTYEQPDEYVTGSVIDSNQITLKKVKRGADGSGEYIEIEDGQILSNEVVQTGKNYIEVVATEQYEKIVQIAVKGNIDKKTLQILTPKEVLFEGGRELVLEKAEVSDLYYVYGKNGIMGIYMDPSSAVNQAYANSGVVLNEFGDYIWRKGRRNTKNQIMAIIGMQVTEEKDSLAVCLDTMLKFEGVMRNTEYQLNQGNTVLSILGENMEDTQILDLTGCSLDAILYYVDKDIPVLAMLNDGGAVLIIGFNELNIVVMDPITGNVGKRGMNDSRVWLEENGNSFITYAKQKQ